MKPDLSQKQKFSSFLASNNVTILFVILCIGAYFASGTNLNFLLPELFTRIGRNTFMVLSLIIPVVAGLGLNFGIVIGAIAAQISIFLISLWGITGIPAIILCAVISTPLSIFFGWLVGNLFNSMKGTEMIAGLVAGYFSDGIYQLLFLFILGGIIPINNKTLMISTGTGVKNTIDLKDNLKYVLDNTPMISILDFAFWAVLIWAAAVVIFSLIKKEKIKVKNILNILVPIVVLYILSYIPSVYLFMSTPRLLLLNAIEIGVLVSVIYNLYHIIYKLVKKEDKSSIIRRIIYIVISVVIYILTYVPELEQAFKLVKLPVLTYTCIALLCVFILWLMNTKLGQEMRTVGQDRAVATSAGINVNRTRIIAIIFSTVLASYGHIISLQNIGTLATYGSHLQVGLYSIAALLVGGASVNKATVKQAILGIILFHTLFILSPIAGKELFGVSQVGEYFRVFIAYGVIAVALALHARTVLKKRQAESML